MSGLRIRDRPTLGRGGYGTVRFGELQLPSGVRRVAVKQLRSENESMDLRVAYVSDDVSF